MNRSLFVTFLLIVLSINKFRSQTLNFEWATGVSIARSLAITTDASGNVFNTGYFVGPVDFDPGPGTYTLSSNMYDVFISKLDAAGNFLWAKSLGGDVSDYGYSIATDALGNVYTTGSFADTVDFDPGVSTFTLASASSAAFVLKLDAAGNFVWAKSFGGSFSGSGNSITIDPLGYVYTTGSFSGIVDFDPGVATYTLSGGGAGDVFISKLDASGNFVLAKNFGGIQGDWGYSIAVDGSGNIYTAGYFRDTADFDPGPGTFTIATSSSTLSPFIMDIFISKLDPVGNFVWAKSLAVASSTFGPSPCLTVDAAGMVYSTGTFKDTVDFDPGAGTFDLSANFYDIFISKLDASGNFLWAKNIGGVSWDVGYSIAVDASSNVYTTGTYRDVADFDPGVSSYTLSSYLATNDIFILKLDANGNFVWAQGIGGKSGDSGNSIDVDAAGNIYTTGFCEDTVDFDPGPATFTLASVGGSFVHKMSQGGIGINESIISENTIKVFPNPTSGEFILVSQNKNETIKVFDITGRNVLEKEKVVSDKLTIDVSKLPSGIYFIEVNSEKGISRTKLIRN